MTENVVAGEVRNSSETRTWKLVVTGGTTRLDRYLAGQLRDLTRSRLHGLIGDGFVLVNGGATKPAQQVRAGDVVDVTVPKPREVSMAAEDIPVPLVYQDNDIVVVDKPAGLAVHPGPGHPSGTLVNALLARCPGIEGVGGEIRPGIVHRLDKDTSGLMVVAKNDAAHHHLSESLKDREVRKEYLALAEGEMSAEEGVIDRPIGRHPRNRKKMAVVEDGRTARTGYQVLERFEGATLVRLSLETGRTHQIRVHLAHLGHPLVGDGVYGKGSGSLGRQFLHACRLGFEHPSSGEFVEFRSELPEDLSRFLEGMRREGGLHEKTVGGAG